jgi:hypothetical protein
VYGSGVSEIRVEDRGSRVEGRGFEYWRVEDLKVGGMRVEGLSRGESQQCARRGETSGRKNPRKKCGFVWAKQALWWKGAHLNFLCDFVYFVCFELRIASTVSCSCFPCAMERPMPIGKKKQQWLLFQWEAVKDEEEATAARSTECVYSKCALVENPAPSSSHEEGKDNGANNQVRILSLSVTHTHALPFTHTALHKGEEGDRER